MSNKKLWKKILKKNLKKYHIILKYMNFLRIKRNFKNKVNLKDNKNKVNLKDNKNKVNLKDNKNRVNLKHNKNKVKSKNDLKKFSLKLLNYLKNKIFKFWLNKIINKISIKGKKEKIEILFLKMNILRIHKILKPTVFFNKIWNRLSWKFNLILKRQGKYYRYLPILIFRPKNYILGLRMLRKIILQKKINKSIFFERMFLEFWNIRIHPLKSNTIQSRNKVLEGALKNKTLLNFRWRA